MCLTDTGRTSEHKLIEKLFNNTTFISDYNPRNTLKIHCATDELFIEKTRCESAYTSLLDKYLILSTVHNV